jgi:hypothetical protein
MQPQCAAHAPAQRFFSDVAATLWKHLFAQRCPGRTPIGTRYGQVVP